MNVCVYGAASQRIDEAYLRAAEELGRALALRGFSLVFGGGATGVMGAAARGAASVGGKIIGVAPRFFNQEGILYQSCTQFHFTDTMRQRKELMESLSDAFVMAPGGIGTLEEFFEILTLRQLGRHTKPIFILNTRGYYNSLGQMLEEAVHQGFLDQSGLGLYHMVDKASTLVQELEEALQRTISKLES